MGIPLDHFFTKVDPNASFPFQSPPTTRSSREVLRNPVSCRDGHAFCEACVVEWLARHANCPMDRRPLAKRELIRNLPVGGLIDVRCVNADVGAKAKARNASSPSPKRFGAACTCTCTWRGKARNLDDHVRECPYANVSCPHPLCGDVMLRKFVDAHARTCPKRSVSCHACALEMAACDLDEHIEHDCPLAMVPCINGCLTDGTVTMVSRRIQIDIVNYYYLFLFSLGFICRITCVTSVEMPWSRVPSSRRAARCAPRGASSIITWRHP